MNLAHRLPLVLLAVWAPSLAAAQATGVRTVAPANPMGPPIAGVCLFGRDAALGASRAGQAANARLRQLSQSIQADLAPEQQAIVAEDNALKASASLIPATERQRRADLLQRRAAAFGELEKRRAAQLQQTRATAMNQILKQMEGLLGSVSADYHCSVVFERTTTYAFNTAMDVTPSVVQRLDVRMPTMTFDLAPPVETAR